MLSLIKYESRVVPLLVLSWASVRRVALGSAVVESGMLSGMVCVKLLSFRLLRYVCTMVIIYNIYNNNNNIQYLYSAL